MTQPIPSDRLATPIPDRDRSPPARAGASPSPTSGQAGIDSPPATETSHLSRGSALLRNAAAAPGSGAIADSEQARALAARVSEALRGDPARAVQAYAAVRRDDVHALLVTA